MTAPARDRMAEASEWFMRLRDEPATDAVIEAWSQWCGEHPDNARCYRDVQRIWSMAGDAGAPGWPQAPQLRDDAYTGDISIREWRQRSAAPPARRGWLGRPLGLAAALILALGVWQLWLYMTRLPEQGVYASARGEKQDLRLADGSVITLGGASQVRVAFDGERRSVMLERGEAFFNVARDRNRPFVVTASDLTVTAIGTAFAVRSDAVRTVVAVTEGLVEVVQGPPAGAAEPARAVRAKAGEQVTCDSGTAFPVLARADSAAAIGWQDGAFVYVDEPLRSVVARINRYSSHEVVLGDEALGDLGFTGTVFERQVLEWASGLEKVFPIRVARDAQGRVILQRREDAAAPAR